MIVTISRQFGSGGRELGRRLAEELGIAYYDHEIVDALLEKTNLAEEYVRSVEEQRVVPLLPITIGSTFSAYGGSQYDPSLSIFTHESEIIKEIAEKSDCVIVGRCADYVLRDKDPYRIFIYADIASRVERCQKRAKEGEKTDFKDMKRHIEKVDSKRAKYYWFHTDQDWGKPEYYDLCVNTSGRDLKELAAKVAAFVRAER